MNSKRGDIFTLVAIGAVIILGVVTAVSSSYINNRPQTNKTQASEGNCRDNPVGGLPSGYIWKATCDQTCTSNDACKSPPSGGTGQSWCFGFDGGAKCMYVIAPNSGGGQSQPTPTSAVSNGGGDVAGCRNNPVAPPADNSSTHYEWRPDCLAPCTTNDSCGNPPPGLFYGGATGTTGQKWCYGFQGGARCMWLMTFNKSVNSSPTNTPIPVQPTATPVPVAQPTVAPATADTCVYNGRTYQKGGGYCSTVNDRFVCNGNNNFAPLGGCSPGTHCVGNETGIGCQNDSIPTPTTAPLQATPTPVPNQPTNAPVPNNPNPTNTPVPTPTVAYNTPPTYTPVPAQPTAPPAPPANSKVLTVRLHNDRPKTVKITRFELDYKYGLKPTIFLDSTTYNNPNVHILQAGPNGDDAVFIPVDSTADLQQIVIYFYYYDGERIELGSQPISVGISNGTVLILMARPTPPPGGG